MKQVSQSVPSPSSDDLQRDADVRPAAPEMRERGLFGRRLRLLRERLGLSQAEFGLRYDLPLGDLAAWERGRVTPDADIIDRVSAIEADPALRLSAVRT